MPTKPQVVKPPQPDFSEEGRRFVDKYGRFHSEAILKNWSPQALHALGVRRLEPLSTETPPKAR
jgi:hypothetical protein